jgi:plastocyanin
MPRKLLVILALLPLALGAVAFWQSGRDASAQTTTTVNVGDFYFCDASFSNAVCDTNINVGDTVMWQWVGNAPHTVTQCDPTFTTCPPPGGFDSGTMTSGSFPQTFNTPGSFEYQCNIHTVQMRGRVNVAAAQQVTPTATAGVTTTTGATPTAGQTTAPGQTTAATPVRTSAAPAAVPQTGGGADDGGLPAGLLVAIAGIGLAAAGGALGLRRLRGQ